MVTALRSLIRHITIGGQPSESSRGKPNDRKYVFEDLAVRVQGTVQVKCAVCGNTNFRDDDMPPYLKAYPTIYMAYTTTM